MSNKLKRQLERCENNLDDFDFVQIEEIISDIDYEIIDITD